MQEFIPPVISSPGPADNPPASDVTDVPSGATAEETRAGASEIALCLKDPVAIAAVSRILSAASSGLELHSGNHPDVVLDSISSSALKLLLMDASFLAPGALEAVVARYPQTKIALIADQIDASALQEAAKIPAVVGFIARRQGVIRAWELVYLVRRVMNPDQPPPSSLDLLNWGAASVTFRPNSSRERDKVVEAVEVVAHRFGMTSRMAKAAAEASHEMLMNAIYDAPVDKRGRPRYAAKRTSPVVLQSHEIPTLQVAVDGLHIALDITDPFGRLPREKLFSGILRGMSGATAEDARAVLDESSGGAGLGLFQLFNSSAILRVEVVPGRQTTVSWLLDLALERRPRQQTARSLYFIEAPA